MSEPEPGSPKSEVEGREARSKVQGPRSEVGLGLELGAEGSKAGEPGTLVVRVPRGIRSKEKLFAVMADKLRLPRYFGWNWDALEECLRDLSWLPPTQGVTIVHDDLPFGAGGQNRAVYLSLLRGVLGHWNALGGRSIRAVFPPDAAEMFG